MKTKRLFTDAELKEAGTPTETLIAAAIDAGDGEKAKKLSQRMGREFLFMHDLYLNWVASLLSFIYKRYGGEITDEALRESVATWGKSLVERQQGKELKKRLLMSATGIRGHMQPMQIEEDDEKFTFTFKPCGSGARLALDGAYGPPKNFSRVSTPCVMTYGRKDFPIYCSHDPILEILAIELTGYPFFVTEPSADIGKIPCRGYLYKDPKDIPDKYYQRIGKKKPK